MVAILNLAAILDFRVPCLLNFDQIFQILYLEEYLVNCKYITGKKLLHLTKLL